MRIFATAIAIAAICISGLRASATDWNECVLAAVDSFPERGGYYTGGRPNADFSKTTIQALNEAFQMDSADNRPSFTPALAQPSFCSSATYAVLIKALLMWDTDNAISRKAWENMRPLATEDDGFGFWGRANANGPGLGVLVHELGAGNSIAAFRGAYSERNRESDNERYLSDEEWATDSVWDKATPGDFMKLFWNRNPSGSDSGAVIGCNNVAGDDQERGHSVVFLGYEPNGDIRYWSSNGPGKDNRNLGYSIGSCPRSHVQRVVVTHITRPDRFDNARQMPPDSENRFLSDLNGRRHATTAEMLRQIGAE